MGRVNLDNAKREVANRRPFTSTTGSLTGVAYAPSDTGQLPRELAEQFLADRDKIVYTVRSYATPIAWVISEPDGAEQVVIPDARYSVTTSRHQGITRTYL